MQAKLRNGQYDRRGPITVPFTEEEEAYIEGAMLYPERLLMQQLPSRAWVPKLYREQRMIQEAIERKRANGQGQ